MRTPVFDIGDTLMPCYRLQNQLIQERLRMQGVEDPPEFPVNTFRIYNPSHVQEFLDMHGIEGDAEKLVEEYKDKEEKYLEENRVFEMLRTASEELGTVGFVSDNSLKGKDYFRGLLESRNVPYDGFVVSQEVGVEKPDSKIFREFLSRRGGNGSDYTYFGNNVPRDIGCRKVGMDFVWVTQYETFSGSYGGRTLEELSFRSVKQALDNV
ncbi:MAG: HAD family hydrolase [Candidatus Nanohaloarchaea archaeon]